MHGRLTKDEKPDARAGGALGRAETATPTLATLTADLPAAAGRTGRTAHAAGSARRPRPGTPLAAGQGGGRSRAAA